MARVSTTQRPKLSNNSLIGIAITLIVVAIIAYFIGHSTNPLGQLPQNVSVHVITNRTVITYSILYPNYINSGYNANYIGYFSPTGVDLYYDYWNGSYIPLPLINLTKHGYDFNLTANRTGYMILNYTSNSSMGLYAGNSDCYLNLNAFYKGTLLEDTYDNSAQNGTLVLPVHKGKNCFTLLSSSTQLKTSITFNATFIYFGYPSSIPVIH